MRGKLAAGMLAALAIGCAGGPSGVGTQGQGAGAERARRYPCRSLGEVLRAVQATQPARVGWVLPAVRLEEPTGKDISNDAEAWQHLRSKAGVLVRESGFDLCTIVDSGRPFRPALTVQPGGPLMWDRLASRTLKIVCETEVRMIMGFVGDAFSLGMKSGDLDIDRDRVYSVCIPPMPVGELLMVLADGWGIHPSIEGGWLVWRSRPAPPKPAGVPASRPSD